MITELILLLVVGCPYYFGYISIYTIIFMYGFIYWLPKWFFMRILNRFFPEVVTHKQKNNNIALTFDDVPYGDPANIINIINKLDFYGMKATFFIISDYLTKETESILIQAIRNGHQLGNHGKTNSMHFLKSNKNLSDEIDECDKKIRELYKQARIDPPKTMVYRPGCGFFGSSMLKIVKDKNYKLVLGSVYPNDPMVRFSTINYLYLIEHIEKGDIVILHDRQWTPDTLDKLLLWLIENMYESVTLDEFI